MKIALVSPYDLAIAGGVNSNIHPLAHFLRLRGHEAYIIGPANNRTALRDPNHTFVIGKTRPIPAGGSIANLAISTMFYGYIKQVLEEEKFDVIHINEPFVVGYGMQFIRYAGDAICVGTFHAARASVPRLYKTLRPLMWDLMHRLDLRIAVSPAARRLIQPVFPGDYSIIPNGIDYLKFAHDDHQLPPLVDDKMINILFVGRIGEKRKGLVYLLEAFTHLKPLHPNVRLIIVGGYNKHEKKRFDKYIAKNQLKDVVLTGYVSDEELVRYHHACQIFCAPNTGNESQGIILLQAMAAGLPIVASGIDGFSNVVAQNVQGILVPPSDASSLYIALEQLVVDESLRSEMGHKGHQEASKYDWPLIAEAVDNGYKESFKKRSTRSSGALDETGYTPMPA